MSENGNRIDGRLCVHAFDEEGNFNIDRSDTSIFEAAQVFRHIGTFIRYLHVGGKFTPGEALIDGYSDGSFEPTDDPRICIVWNPNTRQIRFSTIGIDLWDAEALVEYAAIYMQALIINPVDVVTSEMHKDEDGGANNQ